MGAPVDSLILILVDSQAEMLSERMLAKSDAEFVIQNTSIIPERLRLGDTDYWQNVVV